MTITDTLGETTGNAEFIAKGWGHELVFVNNDYCGKLLYFVSGKKCSLHVHHDKHETFYLKKGSMEVYYHDNEEELRNILQQKNGTTKVYEMMERVVLTQGMTFTVPVGRAHQMVALEDCELFEFSTHDDAEDSHRIIKGDQL